MHSCLHADACDEKYNYERLVTTTTMHTQQLLVPRPLDLTASEEATVLAHQSVFAANGFNFTHSPEADPGRRVRLTTVPFSKNIQVRRVEQLQRVLCVLHPAFPSPVRRRGRARTRVSARRRITLRRVSPSRCAPSQGHVDARKPSLSGLSHDWALTDAPSHAAHRREPRGTRAAVELPPRSSNAEAPRGPKPAPCLRGAPASLGPSTGVTDAAGNVIGRALDLSCRVFAVVRRDGLR